MEGEESYDTWRRGFLQHQQLQEELEERLHPPDKSETFCTEFGHCSDCLSLPENERLCSNINLHDESRKIDVIDCDDFNPQVRLAAAEEGLEQFYEPETYLNITLANKFERNTINYVSGYSFHMGEKTFKDSAAQSFVASLVKRNDQGEDEFNDLIEVRDFETGGPQVTRRLKKPKAEYSDAVAVLLDFFERNWKSVWYSDRVVGNLLRKAESNEMIQKLWLKEKEGDTYATRLALMKLIFTIKVFHQCRRNNEAALKQQQLQRRENRIKKEEKRQKAEEKASLQGQIVDKYDGKTRRLIYNQQV